MTAVYGDGKVIGYIKDMYGQIWIFNGSNWTCIEESYSEEVKEYVTNCPNCGAPMTNHKCTYCGTEDYGRR